MKLANRFGILLSAIVGFATAANAQHSPVLVELFTSQGCAACPPADKILDSLADRDDVIALALHVDYWDYIGWTDSFGQAKFSKRQKDYARSKGRASVYTPQMIIGGIDEVQGSSHPQVMATLARHLSMVMTESDVHLTLTGNPGSEVSIEAVAVDGLAFAAEVQLVRYRDAEAVDILGGENNGKSVVYRNIVTSWDVIATWDGVRPFRQSIPITGDDPVVVVIQEQGKGHVLATARRR
jgi:hypothetical protein